MVIFELRSRRGKKVGAVVALVLAGLSLFTMFSKSSIFSEGEGICIVIASMFWGVCTMLAAIKITHRFCCFLCEASFFLTLFLLIAVFISLYV